MLSLGAIQTQAGGWVWPVGQSSPPAAGPCQILYFTKGLLILRCTLLVSEIHTLKQVRQNYQLHFTEKEKSQK